MIFTKDGKIDDCLNRSLPHQNLAVNNPIIRSFKQMHSEFISTICKLDYLSTSCKEKIVSWSIQNLLINSRLMMLHVASQPMRNGFLVLNHGDNWINNMLFRNDENGNLIDVKFIDFQKCYCGSPIGDLMNFLITSVEDDVKTAHFDELVAFYHKELIKSLNELKYTDNAPTLDVLKQDLMEKRGFSKRKFNYYPIFFFFLPFSSWNFFQHTRYCKIRL